MHPGGNFARRATATWAAPATGLVLLRVAANCDVVFFSDAEAEGCDVGMNGGKAYDCLGSNNGVCAAELKLAITRNAYFVEGLAVAAEMFPQPTTGKAVRTITVNFSGTEVEALAAEMFAAQPAADRTLAIPPSIDEVLTPESEAQALLAAMFTTKQQPHLIFPTEIDTLTAEMFDSSMGAQSRGGHRRQQSASPQSQGEAIVGVRISLRAEAPTEAEAQAAVMTLDRIAISGRR